MLKSFKSFTKSWMRRRQGKCAKRCINIEESIFFPSVSQLLQTSAVSAKSKDSHDSKSVKGES